MQKQQTDTQAALTDFLHSFVQVTVDVIDARSPYNAQHTRSMVRYAERFIAYLSAHDTTWDFPKEERDPFLMSIWLHDLGKLNVPLTVMDKRTRLGQGEETVRHRIETGLLMDRIRLLEEPERAPELKAHAEALRKAGALIREANEAVELTDEMLARIEALGSMRCLTAEGDVIPLLTEEERGAIAIRRGTLTPAEREEMERHVVYTKNLLARMTFSDIYENVPAWAAAHHEFLDGSGYPEGRTAEQLPREVRLLTILDIYDALTAEDRPYKPPMEPEGAFAVLHGMADEGKLDGEILRLFEESGAWRPETEEEVKGAVCGSAAAETEGEAG